MQKRAATKITRNGNRRNTGAVLVESVVGVILLSVIIFGIAELGFACKDSAAMYNYARDCARDLAAGKQYTGTVSKICTAANGSGAFTQTLSNTNFAAYYSLDGGKTFPTSNPVQNDGSSGISNNIPQGAYFRVDLSYTHSRVTDVLGIGTTQMHAYVIMMRP
jgi:Flp pilus assembly protein TadG